MDWRSVRLGSSQIHQLFCLGISSFSNAHYKAEFLIFKLKCKPVKFNLLQPLDILFIDEVGNVSTELIHMLEISLMRLHKNSIPFGGVLIICTPDHT